MTKEAELTRPTQTGSEEWKTRLDGLLTKAIKDFFPDGIAFELPCESRKSLCTTDMLALKSILLRELSTVPAIAPYTRETIRTVLRTTAEAAVKQCTGGDSKRQCGFYWSEGVFVKPNTTGAGETMGVLSAVQGLLAVDLDGQKAAVGGGNGSTGDAAGGAGGAGGAGNTDKPNGAVAKGAEGMAWMAMAGAVGVMLM